MDDDVTKMVIDTLRAFANRLESYEAELTAHKLEVVCETIDMTTCGDPVQVLAPGDTYRTLTVKVRIPYNSGNGPQADD